ncbi:P-loop ATPase, Sll1717 family [Candidatus Pantoea rara]|uniref:P-loop ATPase, Sll1717 family n=1 Tax=Candidatus Pantoea rara TaxID=1947037 RepID=UPI003EBBD4C0
MDEKAFFGYPGNPNEIGEVIEAAIASYNKRSMNAIVSWKALEIAGAFIADQVLKQIDESDLFLADISHLNFNVTYEIGYAIGKSKRVILFKNKSLVSKGVKISDVGIFDTLGYHDYENSSDLIKLFSTPHSSKSLDALVDKNLKAPVYLLDTPNKTDWSTKIISRIKKAGFIFRNFDPNESPRLSAYDAINQVSQSYGVVVPLLGSNSAGAEIHNMRAAFIAGLADGMGKAMTIIQSGDEPVPIDYRDFVNCTYHPDDVNQFIEVFAADVTQSFQNSDSKNVKTERSFLKRINLGATSAENEMRELERYYLETDQFLKSLRGEAHLVVGRKGSGKSAIFIQIRDAERGKNRAKNIVLDLKPDGYKLIKFKERILKFLAEGTYQHTVTAFWEYVLLLEICYKILEKDKQRHIHDHQLYEGYRQLSDLYHVDDYDSEGDFSERMSTLMEKIYSEYQYQYGSEENVSLTSPEVTELLYKHDVKKLKSLLSNYLKNKEYLWLLFDNIDNGWPTSGLKHEDLLMIRALIDATRKIERQFHNDDLKVRSIVFLRNDVYELLVKETSDRGKEASVLLDWTDTDLLRELVRLRIVSNGLDESLDFKSAWLRLFVSHHKGEETSQFLIERSLMRPRFLLNLINHCKSFAINLNHDLIESSDIEKGTTAYSSDLLRDIGYELSDIYNESDGILYSFVSCPSELSEEDVLGKISSFGIDQDNAKRILDLLLWYGFLGIKINSDDPKFIYDFSYNKALMDGIKKNSSHLITLVINQAFWPSLMINH